MSKTIDGNIVRSTVDSLSLVTTRCEWSITYSFSCRARRPEARVIAGVGSPISFLPVVHGQVDWHHSPALTNPRNLSNHTKMSGFDSKMNQRRSSKSLLCIARKCFIKFMRTFRGEDRGNSTRLPCAYAPYAKKLYFWVSKNSNEKFHMYIFIIHMRS
jgi:hypothetical protein